MDENYDVKAQAKKQYLNYFKVWFVILVVLVLACGAKLIISLTKQEEIVERTNLNAPDERVYDEAKVLSDEEEEKLRKLIAEVEGKIHCDIVLRTIDQPVEGREAVEKYGYRQNDWELNMVDLADDFFDYGGFGYDDVAYSGALILDNWYEDQEGTTLSTSGAVYEKFGDYENHAVVDEIYYVLKQGDSPYKAYVAGIKKIEALIRKDEQAVAVSMGSMVMLAIVVPIVVAAIFVAVHMKSKQGEVTTTSNTYVMGNPKMNRVSDDYIRKSVSTRVIQSSSSSGSRSSGSGGRGGSHRSSSGRSHGGASRRR